MMNRHFQRLVFFVCCWLPGPLVAQRYDVAAIRVIALAQVPIEIIDPGQGVVISPTIQEYRVFSEWNYNKGISGRPESFNLAIMIVNRGETPVEMVEVTMLRDRLIGDRLSTELSLPPPDPVTQANWEGFVQIESMTIESLEGHTARVINFGPFSTNELWQTLWQEDLWPWKVKYEVVTRCERCSSTRASTSFDMIHGL